MNSLSVSRCFSVDSITASGKKKFLLGDRHRPSWIIIMGSLALTSPLFLMMPAIAQTPDNPLTGVTVKVPGGGCLNARKTPSPYGEIYDCIENNSVLKPIINEQNGWYQLSSGGWVWKEYTSKASSGGDEKPPATSRSLKYTPPNLMQGEDVRKLQTKLNEHRVSEQPLVVDGVFGLSTKQAVEALQRRHSLTVDGIVGSEVRNLLKL